MGGTAQPAGEFGGWLEDTLLARERDRGADVPCNGCNACCRSAYFIHVRPEEHAALEAIPDAVKFPAPGLPAGHVLLGYDDQGACPMLVEDRCSIYDVRPLTCRAFDCRVLHAAAVDLEGEPGKAPVAERARGWHFELADRVAGQRLEAVRAAARYLDEERERLPEGFVPGNGTQRAMLALVVHEVFLEPVPNDPDVLVGAVLAAAGADPADDQE